MILRLRMTKTRIATKPPAIDHESQLIASRHHRMWFGSGIGSKVTFWFESLFSDARNEPSSVKGRTVSTAGHSIHVARKHRNGKPMDLTSIRLKLAAQDITSLESPVQDIVLDVGIVLSTGDRGDGPVIRSPVHSDRSQVVRSESIHFAPPSSRMISNLGPCRRPMPRSKSSLIQPATSNPREISKPTQTTSTV